MDTVANIYIYIYILYIHIYISIWMNPYKHNNLSGCRSHTQIHKQTHTITHTITNKHTHTITMQVLHKQTHTITQNTITTNNIELTHQRKSHIHFLRTQHKTTTLTTTLERLLKRIAHLHPQTNTKHIQTKTNTNVQCTQDPKRNQSQQTYQQIQN